MTRIEQQTARLHEAILAAGIPIKVVRGTGPTCELVFDSVGPDGRAVIGPATAAQRTQAVTMRNGWDWGATSTVDEDLRGTANGPKLTAALVMGLDLVRRGVAGASWPAWVRDTLAAAKARIDATVAGRTPDGTE